MENIIKAETITIIGKLETAEKAIKKLQDGNQIEWFVISSEPSKKIQDTFVIKLIKKGDNN